MRRTLPLVVIVVLLCAQTTPAAATVRVSLRAPAVQTAPVPVVAQTLTQSLSALALTLSVGAMPQLPTTALPEAIDLDKTRQLRPDDRAAVLRREPTRAIKDLRPDAAAQRAARGVVDEHLRGGRRITDAGMIFVGSGGTLRFAAAAEGEVPAAEALSAAGATARGLAAGMGRVADGADAAGILENIYDARDALARSARETPVDASDVGSVYRGFLTQLGFEPYAADIADTLAGRDLGAVQERVLKTAQKRTQILDVSREIAVAVMRGLERQEYRPQAVARAVDLAARLIELRPLEAPRQLPHDVYGRRKFERLRWLLDVTRGKTTQQAASLTSDIIGTMYSPEEIAYYLTTPVTMRRQKFAARVGAVRDQVHDILETLYADVETGGGRYAGRALAAALTRHARVDGKPEVEAALRAAFAARGFELEEYVGNRFTLHDRRGRKQTLSLKTGDVLGTRGRSRRSSEIAIGAVPHPARWWNAWRRDLLGSILGPFMKPLDKYPPQIAGQPLRNRLRRTIHALRKRVANTGHFLRGYSHVGIADVREVDGVVNVMVWESEVDAEEGGIRPVSFWDQFLVKDYHARFGLARLDAGKVWDSFQRQARERGFEELPHRTEKGAWRSAISREEYENLKAIPRERAHELLDEMHGRAIRLIRGLMAGFGIGYGYGLADTLLRLMCTSTIWHGYKVGAQFEWQSQPDMFHPLTYLLKRLGTANTRDLNMETRIIWPGGYFADDKLALHQNVNLPGRDGGMRPNDRQTMPVYRERDARLTHALRGLLMKDAGDPFAPPAGGVEEALRRQLAVRAWRRRDPGSRRSGLSLPRGYFKDVEMLYDR